MQGWHSSQEHLLTRRRWPAHPSRAGCPSGGHVLGFSSAVAQLAQVIAAPCVALCIPAHSCCMAASQTQPPNASQPADTQPVSDGGRMMRHSPAQGSVPSSLLHDCVWGAESRRQPHSLQLSGLKHLLCPQRISLSPLASVDVDADADGKGRKLHWHQRHTCKTCGSCTSAVPPTPSWPAWLLPAPWRLDWSCSE